MKEKWNIRLLLSIVHCIFFAGLLFAGIGSMPSVLGMLFLMLAVFVAPRKILNWWMEDWWNRALSIAALLIYMGTIPAWDTHLAAGNIGKFVQWILEGICTVFG